jgi:hypothetical protein
MTRFTGHRTDTFLVYGKAYRWGDEVVVTRGTPSLASRCLGVWRPAGGLQI